MTESELSEIISRLEDEIGRLRTAFRVNMMRFGATDAEINAVLNNEQQAQSDPDEGLPTANEMRGILRDYPKKPETNNDLAKALDRWDDEGGAAGSS